MNFSALRFAVNLAGICHQQFAMVGSDLCKGVVVSSYEIWNSLHCYAGNFVKSAGNCNFVRFVEQLSLPVAELLCYGDTNKSFVESWVDQMVEPDL